MMSDNRTLEERQFVEDTGMFFEHEGMPRMAGRVLGWLMICDPPHQSSTELAEALMASKGSISTTTRLLISVGLIERFVIPGVRHDYFRIRPDAWQNVMERSATQLKIGRQIAERGLELTRDKNPITRKWLGEMRDLYEFLELELPALLERWEREHDAGKPLVR